MKEIQYSHRGRFQAQGKVLEESEPWNETDPLPVDKGLRLIEKLEKKLTKDELKVRVKAFSKCRDIVKEASKKGGINFPYKKSFYDSLLNRVERVDLEVHGGTAFVDKKENGKEKD